VRYIIRPLLGVSPDLHLPPIPNGVIVQSKLCLCRPAVCTSVISCLDDSLNLPPKTYFSVLECQVKNLTNRCYTRILPQREYHILKASDGNPPGLAVRSPCEFRMRTTTSGMRIARACFHVSLSLAQRTLSSRGLKWFYSVARWAPKRESPSGSRRLACGLVRLPLRTPRRVLPKLSLHRRD
jgi:hypothetical protein